MKRNNIIGIVSFLIISALLLLAGAWPGSQEADSTSLGYVPNEVLVKFEKDVNKYIVQGALNNLNGKIITYIGKEIFPSEWDPAVRRTRSFLSDPHLLHIRIPEYVGTAGAIDYLEKFALAKYAEKNYLLYPTAIYPNDTYFGKLWGLFNRGQTGGKIGVYPRSQILEAHPLTLVLQVDLATPLITTKISIAQSPTIATAICGAPLWRRPSYPGLLRWCGVVVRT